MENIRNFSIIAHVDHGKTTLADRMLEITGSIAKREMKDQMLDTMDIERERGITIKMQPVSMKYKDYHLNLIDTPGHIDFSYEVSRSLRAVDGVVLLVDSTQGVQAQTLSVLNMARDLKLKIIPVLTKIDMDHSRVQDVSLELGDLLDVDLDEILTVSGKTGEGVEKLLDEIIARVPAPIKLDSSDPKALVFDFSFSTHNGVTAYARIFSGNFKKGETYHFNGINTSFKLKDIGIFTPEKKSTNELSPGMIGYFTTGIKEAGLALVGDTITLPSSKQEAFQGYEKPTPVVWASIYPKDGDAYDVLHQALKELRLSDSSLNFEEEKSSILGRGFRCGFLGMLHIEIITERLKRETGIDLIITSPSTDYTVKDKKGKIYEVTTPSDFPDRHLLEYVEEPWVEVSIVTTNEHISAVSQLFFEYEGNILEVKDFQTNRSAIKAEMPLRELMRNFFDRLKGVSSGYASLSYKRVDKRVSDVVRLDVLLAEELFSAFSIITSKARVEKEARQLVEILYETIPRALFVIKVQAAVGGKVIASKTLSALRKDVTAKLYGGDVTRKMKLKEKQKKGKKKMNISARVQIPNDVFLKVMQKKSF